MRRPLINSVLPKVVLASLLATAGVLCLQPTTDGEEAAAPVGVRRVDVQSAKIPMEYADLYERLNRRVDLDWKKTNFGDGLAALQKSLESEIIADTEGVNRDQLNKEVTLDFGQPVTIKYALRALMNQVGLHAHQITFENGNVRLIGSEAAKEQYVLQTHDLRFISSYSTAMRRKLIDQVRRDTTPDLWDKAHGPWMAPGSSVFTVDLYHHPKVHHTVMQSLYEKHRSSWHVGIFPQPVFGLGVEKGKVDLAQRAKEMREKYSFESLAPRLKYEENKGVKSVALSPEAKERLAKKDTAAELASKSKHHWLNLRRASLAALHSNEVEKFVAREGFGISRMPQPGPSFLPLQPPPQLALPSAEIDPPVDEPFVRVPQNEAEAGVAAVDLPVQRDLTNLHAASEGIFVSPQRLGFAKDRDHVAGFGSHAFNQLPRLTDSDGWQAEPEEQWAVRRLELVSLLKHDTPRVYVSEELPRLDKIGKVATRELGEFEVGALEKLTAGEDVVVQGTINRIEMLGSLRAAKNCLECHSVEHGQLLGAFSYTLVRDPLVDPESLTAE